MRAIGTVMWTSDGHCACVTWSCRRACGVSIAVWLATLGKVCVCVGGYAHASSACLQWSRADILTMCQPLLPPPFHLPCLRRSPAFSIPYPLPLWAPSLVSVATVGVDRSPLTSPSVGETLSLHAGCLVHPHFVPCKHLDYVVRDACAAYRLWRSGLGFDLLTWACAI